MRVDVLAALAVLLSASAGAPAGASQASRGGGSFELDLPFSASELSWGGEKLELIPARKDDGAVRAAVACSDRIVVAWIEEIHHAADWLEAGESGADAEASDYREAVAIVDDVWKGEWSQRVVFRATAADGSAKVRLNDRVLLFLSGPDQAALSTSCLGDWVPRVERVDEGLVVVDRERVLSPGPEESPSDGGLGPLLEDLRATVSSAVEAQAD